MKRDLGAAFFLAAFIGMLLMFAFKFETLDAEQRNKWACDLGIRSDCP